MMFLYINTTGQLKIKNVKQFFKPLLSCFEKKVKSYAAQQGLEVTQLINTLHPPSVAGIIFKVQKSMQNISMQLLQFISMQF